MSLTVGLDEVARVAKRWQRANVTWWCAGILWTVFVVTVISGGASGTGERAARRDAQPGRVRPAWTEKSPGVTSHPVDVIPSDRVRIPAGWPLSRSGRITCYTCHYAIPERPRTQGPMLRAWSDDDEDDDFVVSAEPANSAERRAASRGRSQVKTGHAAEAAGMDSAEKRVPESLASTILPEADSAAGRTRSRQMTQADTRSFCARCHRAVMTDDAAADERSANRAATSRAAQHWLAMDRAHIIDQNGRGSTRAYGDLDAYSRQCLACHDGINAKDSVNVTPSQDRAGGWSSDRHRNHPIGIEYNRPFRDRTLSKLRPASMLPPKVLLPGGRVSCVSCHDLYSDAPFKLSVTIEGSELCFACHEMR